MEPGCSCFAHGPCLTNLSCWAAPSPRAPPTTTEVVSPGRVLERVLRRFSLGDPGCFALMGSRVLRPDGSNVWKLVGRPRVLTVGVCRRGRPRRPDAAPTLASGCFLATYRPYERVFCCLRFRHCVHSFSILAFPGRHPHPCRRQGRANFEKFRNCTPPEDAQGVPKRTLPHDRGQVAIEIWKTRDVGEGLESQRFQIWRPAAG